MITKKEINQAILKLDDCQDMLTFINLEANSQSSQEEAMAVQRLREANHALFKAWAALYELKTSIEETI